MNLRGGRRWRLDDWRLEAFVGVVNATDERYNENVRVNAFGGRFFEPAPDRHAYGGVEVARLIGR